LVRFWLEVVDTSESSHILYIALFEVAETHLYWPPGK